MRLLVCGSRGWKDSDVIAREMAPFLADGGPRVVIHGAAPGADAIAGWLAHFGFCVYTEEFPADWTEGKRAGPLRNARMLAEGKPDRGLAFGPLYRADGKRTGTGDMVQRMLPKDPARRLPVRWVAAPDAPAVDLTEMPEPPT